MEASLATAVVKSIVRAGSVGTGDIGVITPYDAQTTLIKSLLWRESLGGVEVANIDAFQGRESDVVVLSCVRSNSFGQLGHVDENRRLNVALTRAKRGLVVIGDKDTLIHGYESGLGSFIKSVYQRGLVLEAPPTVVSATAKALSEEDGYQRGLVIADFLSREPKDVVMPPTVASATAKALSSHQPDVSRITKRRKKKSWRLHRVGFRRRIAVLLPPLSRLLNMQMRFWYACLCSLRSPIALTGRTICITLRNCRSLL